MESNDIRKGKDDPGKDTAGKPGAHESQDAEALKKLGRQVEV